jgi:prepilin-type N-terminal cleavage/methylation domain-containing protein
MRRPRGFTLLEVMMATVVLAVGTISVLMIFGTALAFAHRRQGQQQLTQVLQEARTDARALVNRYRPDAPVKTAKPALGSKAAPAPSAFVTPAGDTDVTQPRPSAVFAAYRYTLRFAPVRREVPEAGWRTTVTIQWGDGQEYQVTEVMAADSIPDEEFATSSTYAEERAGVQDGKTRETR